MLGKPSPVSFNPGPHTYRRGREVGHDGPILINGELAMGIFRLYTGGDGQSHIGELDLSAHPELTSPLAASTINFREWPRGHFLDWHPAPRRQYIIPLSGAIEIRLTGGRVHCFVPGGARLVEDATGAGHTTRVLGDQPSVDAIIPLA